LLNLSTSYQITPRLQVYGLMQNAFNAAYYTHGTFSPTSSTPIVQVPGASNPRSCNIAALIAVFAGARFKS
jgi:iron complex outermembrane recepter protein